MEFIIIIIGVIIDRLTKLWAINRLAPDRDIVVIKDFFTFSYVENRGAAFGIFQHRVNLLAAITIVIIAGMIYYLIKNRQETLLFRISMAMIISGAIGNLIDRIQYKFVVDFILVHYKTAHFPNFNIADMLVVIGTAFLSIYIIKDVK